MKQIIEEVRQAEEKVNASLQDARTQASQIRATAEKDLATQLNEAKEKSRTIVQEIVEEAKQTSERLRVEKLAQADAAKESLLQSHTETMDRLVDEICQLVLRTGGANV